VTYFKLSSALYDQASYMDVLFLHTAIALDKSGQKEQAKVFYQHVIDNYPNKKSASIAKNRI
jgi:TolA-binding protein